MEQKTAFAVYTNSDLTEGRGREYVASICESVVTAERLAKKAYVMGTDAPVREITLFKHDNQWYGPANVVPMSDTDRIEHTRRMAAAEAERKRLAVLEKARKLGLSDEDIAILKG